MTTIPCRKCQGKGHIPLSEALQPIYDILEQAGEQGSTSAAIAKALEDAGNGANLMAIQNRLMRLEEYGLARRDQNKRPEVWLLASLPVVSAQ